MVDTMLINQKTVRNRGVTILTVSTLLPMRMTTVPKDVALITSMTSLRSFESLREVYKPETVNIKCQIRINKRNIIKFWILIRIEKNSRMETMPLRWRAAIAAAINASVMSPTSNNLREFNSSERPGLLIRS